MTISRSNSSIKVIGSRSWSCAKDDYLFISTCYSFVINKVKVTHQGHFRGGILLRGWFAFESNVLVPEAPGDF